MAGDGKLGRRELLRLGAGLGAAALVPACGPGEAPFDEGQCDPGPADGARPGALGLELPEELERFPLGVQSGSVRATSALVRSYAADDAPKTLRVWREPDLLVAEREVEPSHGFLRASVDGLAANTVYRFAFFGGEARSAVGRFRTAYDGDCRRVLTVGATACTSLRNAPYRSIGALAEQELDLMLHLGDMSYNDGAETIDEFRARWRETLAEPNYRALHARTSLVATWDDHEFTNNPDPERIPGLIATGKQAFFEALPMEPGPGGRLWQSFSWGRTAEFFVLDGRTERRPSTRETPDAQYVSPEQLAWLQEALKRSRAHFKVVLNSVPIIRFDDPVWLFPDDRWQGYAAQRAKLLDFLVREELRNVWFVSGDFHLGMVARVESEGPRSRYREILAGPGANFNPLSLVWPTLSEEDRERICPPRQFDFLGLEFAATTLTFDPARDEVRVRFLDVEGKVLFDRALKES
jgi:alkaline phosphatase D